MHFIANYLHVEEQTIMFREDNIWPTPRDFQPQHELQTPFTEAH
jgi:hypothetical protein